MSANPEFAMPAHLDHARPYEARVLSKPELKKLDVYSFESPKERRLVRVVSLSWIVALRLEFDPGVSAYVERPRLLHVNERRYELDIWYRELDGRERCVMVVPHGTSVADATGRRRHRHAQQLLDAAERASVPLRFEAEADLLRELPHSLARLRMLPLVQTAQRLRNRIPLRQRILQFAASLERFRMSQLVIAMEGYMPSDVRAVACDLVHVGQLQIDPSQPLNAGTLLWRTTP